MANTPQARKRARQNDAHRLRNAAQRSTMRTHVKQFLKLVQSGDAEGAKQALRTAVSVIDRSAQRNLAHRNKAARLKSRLNARLKNLAA